MKEGGRSFKLPPIAIYLRQHDDDDIDDTRAPPSNDHHGYVDDGERTRSQLPVVSCFPFESLLTEQAESKRIAAELTAVEYPRNGHLKPEFIQLQATHNV